MSCSTCYEISLPACTDVIQVNAGLNANNIYTWVIEDHFGNKYQGDVTTDGAGNFEIDLDDLPENLLSPHAGTFILTIINSGGETQAVSFFDTEYTCISMSFHDSNLDPADREAIIPSEADNVTPSIPAELFTVQQLEYTAAENITQYNVITSDFDQADSADVSHADKILALSITTTANGADGLAVVRGKVINPAWTWTVDQDVYLNGTTLSQTPPLTGFSIVIGRATRADAIVVNIGNPTLL